MVPLAFCIAVGAGTGDCKRGLTALPGQSAAHAHTRHAAAALEETRGGTRHPAGLAQIRPLERARFAHTGAHGSGGR